MELAFDKNIMVSVGEVRNHGTGFQRYKLFQHYKLNTFIELADGIQRALM